MSHNTQFGFLNDNNGLLGDLNHLTEDDESDDERDDEIRKLLEEQLNNETFDEGSENSFASVSVRDDDNNKDSSVVVRRNSSTRGEDVKDSVIYTNNNNNNTNNNLVKSSALAFGGDLKDSSVSAIHKKHCPQLGNGDNNNCGDDSSSSNNGNGNGNSFTSTTNKMEHLERLNSYRERQLARAEETIATLTKDKRALNHQIGLTRTEMIQMKAAYSDLEKALGLKEEEVEFMKSKIQEAIVDYESLNKQQRELKDENNRLVSQIGRLEQEIALLSTIGSSAQNAEVDNIVRQIRDRHAQEIINYKTEMSNLEAELKSYKRQIKVPVDSWTTSTQTDSLLSTIGSSAQNAEVDNIVRQIRDRHAQEIINYKTEMSSLEAELKSYKRQIKVPVDSWTTSTQTDALGSSAQNTEVDNIVRQIRDRHAQEIINYKTEMSNLEAEIKSYNRQIKVPVDTWTISTQTDIPLPRSFISKETQVEMEVPSQTPNPAPSRPSQSSLENSTSIEVQTEETLKTYEVLGNLMEQWAAEVSEATQRAETAESQATEILKRAELADSQVQFSEVSLRKLRKKFKSLQTMTSICRQEWKKQEEALKKRNDETKTHYLNILLKLQSTLELEN